jgi:hypothetical protein
MLNKTFIAIALVALAVGTAQAQPEEFGADLDEEGSFGIDEEAEEEADVAPAEEGAVANDGTFGWGVARALSGFVGPEIEYHIDRKLMITGMFGLVHSSPEMGDSSTSFALAAAGFYRVSGFRPVELYLGGRLVLGNGNDATQVNIEVPARIQFYLSNLLALHVETGLVIAIIPENGAVLGPRPGTANGTAIALGAGAPFGAAGVTVYWP